MGQGLALGLILVEEDVEVGDLEIAEKVAYYLTDAFEVVVY